MLVNNVVKEKFFSNSASLSNPNFFNTHATKSFTRSKGIVIKDVANPSIPPLRPPKNPSSFHPSIMPVIVSHAVVTIAIGANTLPTTPAILVTIPPNRPTFVATLLNQNLTLFAGPIILVLIISDAVSIGVIIFFILAPIVVNTPLIFATCLPRTLSGLITNLLFILFKNTPILVPKEAILFVTPSLSLSI